jgi:hypothetical protein
MFHENWYTQNNINACTIHPYDTSKECLGSCVLCTSLNTPTGILFTVKTVITGTVRLVIPYSVVADSKQRHLLIIMAFKGTQHSQNIHCVQEQDVEDL